ncbi:hydroxyacylglutathione hydrolase [Sphingomicrobium sp. B8]|uniref:Hydroxyacylglutathione hydrolase n=1 Tax=Sphingomicrobium clamense TaxID=2851013 RepID=A0ABS6V3H3_9SPHN|nr:hydroxyacylglutathione hydrolase [Sphingomicrobium sp. B8]
MDTHGRFDIACVPAFSDNYHWLAKVGDEVAVVDPGDGEACLTAARELGWTITRILNTHWHPDHVGGNLRVKEATGAEVIGPTGEADKIPGIDHQVDEGDQVSLGGATADVWHIPGHTLGHIAYIFGDDGLAFVGDTIFAMGCGKLFEGTPEQMHGALQRLAGLPAETQLYCAHEYTLSNGKFAAHAFPDDRPIADRLAATQAARDEHRRTVPTTVGEECATNPFLRANDAGEFAELRVAKDRF